MLNNVSYEQIAILVNDITNQTADYLVDNYRETIQTIGANIGDSFTIASDNLESVAENASEYVLDSFNEFQGNAAEFFFENISDINFKSKMLVLVTQQHAILIVDRMCDFMHTYNINITMVINVFIVCLIIAYQIDKLRNEFNCRMTEDVYRFIDENEFRHLKMMDDMRAEFKKLNTAQTRRITNGIKKLQDEQVRHSRRQDIMLYERIRTHRHKELLERICMYLDLFNQYASGDKFNMLFNLSDDITYLNPNSEGAIVKKYFIKYLVWNNTSKSQILYPMNLAYAPNVYAETTRNIRTYADSMPANTTKDLTQFREEVETNYSELFSFPVVRAPNETQVDFEISVFEHLDECLGRCYTTYNMYCSAGLN